ncbi:hypothetical protein BGX31_007850 [Mortierella sp. GBA43]|nr:hypothetical protein BGX31_007850 [Mortierella sp. GBA43]
MSEGYHQQFHVPHPTAIHHERTQHQSHRAKPIAIVPRPSNHQAAAGGVSRPSHTVHTPHESNCPKPSNPSQPTTNATAQQQQQQQPSFHQRQHRAQQQAQSDYSRNYHLQRHLRMLDQQRAAQMAQKQQQQQQQQQSPRIQRQYEPHQLMRPVPSSVPATKPPLQPLERQQPHHLSAQRQLIQSYRQQLQTAQQRPSGNSVLVSDIARMLASSLPRTLIGGPDNGGNLEDSSHKKSERPSECSNCMALEQVNCIPRNSQDTLTRTNGKLLCSTCIQYLQSHGKARPVPPFRVNFLKKIHCRVKRELREVRFRGWQDAQVLQVEDQMTQDDFRAVFHAGVEEGLVITGSSNDPRPTPSTVSVSEPNGSVVIKIEDDDDALDKPSDQPETEVRVFSSETSVNALFGHQWIAEPMIGYTVVHFGGSARTCVVPMNPTIPTLNVTFNRVSGAVVFEFKILVNGLCLPSSGGGPPAMHMPVTQEDEDPEGDQEMEEPAKEGAEEQVAVTAGSAAENTSHEPTNE